MSTSPSASSLAPARTGPAGTVLFVDDEENILAAIRRSFRAFGARILLANGAEQALELLEREHVDVVVSDMRMPGMDGAQLLTLVAERWPDTVRIVMTGYADFASTVMAVNKGRIFRYLSKPWVHEEVQATIAEALAARRTADERAQLQQEVARLHELTTTVPVAPATEDATPDQRPQSQSGHLSSAETQPHVELLERLLERAATIRPDRRQAVAHSIHQQLERRRNAAALTDVLTALTESLAAALRSDDDTGADGNGPTA